MNDDVAGVFDAIDAEGGAHAPAEPEVSTEAVAEGAESGSSTEEAETKTNNSVEDQVTGETPQGETKTEETTKTDEHSETKTEAVDEDWVKTLPPPPSNYDGPQPEIDPETGQITNMTPQQYATYMRESTLAEFRIESYNNFVQNKALEAAEAILPAMKDNDAIRKMVQDIQTASVLYGDQINAFEAAKQVRSALGLGPEQLAKARAEGAQNAKVHIETQSNAAVETGGSQQPDEEAANITALQKRIKRGDNEAFVELLGIWDEAGKL